MPITANNPSIEILKIIYKQQNKLHKNKKTHGKKSYPKGIENRYRLKLLSCYKPITEYINEFLSENQIAMLNGDSVNFDSVPGKTFQKLIDDVNSWLSVYMPSIDSMTNYTDNVIYMMINDIAEQLKKYEDNQFQKQLESGLGIKFPVETDWWENVKIVWSKTNYNLITSNARTYVNQINTLCEQGVVNGWSVKQLTEQIKNISDKLSNNKCRLIARDQIGKLQGQVSQAQMEEIGLEMYVWETSGDERVRSTHIPMDGLLCRWDNANVYSADGGKTWINRPSTAVRMHPGQDIQCRCVAVSYYPELMGKMGENT